MPATVYLSDTQRDHLARKLKKEGKYIGFAVRRTELLAKGLNLQAAWARALKEIYPRLDFSKFRRKPQLHTKPFQPGALRGDVDWVYHHLAAEGLEPKHAPSPGAWALLQETRTRKGGGGVSWFFSDIWIKLLPVKGSEDRAARYDDGRELKLLADIDAAARAAAGV